MSIVTNDRNVVLEYAYTRADQNNEVVIIYYRMVVGEESDEVVKQYIATGVESDLPTNATIDMVIDPQRSPLYDRVVYYRDADTQCC